MNPLNIVMYHYVRDLQNSRYPEIKGLDITDFINQIEYLEDNFNIVRMEEVLEAVKFKRKLPPNSLLLTFDDGYIDHYTNVFPVLKNRGLQGSFFISARTFVNNSLLDVNKIHFLLASVNVEDIKNHIFQCLDDYRSKGLIIEGNQVLFDKLAHETRFDDKTTVFVKTLLQNYLPQDLRNNITSTLFSRFIDVDEKTFAKELYMSYDQIKVMKNNGMFIGVHGFDHYWLGKINEEEMKSDIDQSLLALNDFIDSSQWVMNYPYGSFNEDVIKYVEKRGAVLGLSTRVNVADLDVDCKYSLPRLDTNDYPPKSNNFINIK